MKGTCLFIGCLLLALVLFTGCDLDVKVHEKINKQGDVPTTITITTDTPMLMNMLKEQIQNSTSDSMNYKLVEQTDTTLILEGNLDTTKYSFVKKGNWFKHEYTLTQQAFMPKNESTSEPDFSSAFVTGNVEIEIPGSVDDYGTCFKNTQGHIQCPLDKSVVLKGHCYLFLC